MRLSQSSDRLQSGSTATQKRGVTRRRVLQAGAALAGSAAGSGAITGFPVIWAQNIKDVVLNQAGSPVAAIPKIAEQANKDLGFTVKMQATENYDLLNRFLSQSSSIDMGDVSIVFLKYLVGRGVLQAIHCPSTNTGTRQCRSSPKANTPTAEKCHYKGWRRTACSTRPVPTARSRPADRPSG